MTDDRPYCLTVGENPKGDGFLAVLSRGSPQRGDEYVDVLTLEVVKTRAEAKEWFALMLISQPWKTHT